MLCSGVGWGGWVVELALIITPLPRHYYHDYYNTHYTTTITTTINITTTTIAVVTTTLNSSRGFANIKLSLIFFTIDMI